MQGIRILKAGEQGLVVEFGDAIDPVTNARVHRLAGLIARHMSGQIVEMVPTYRSLMVFFDPLVIARKELEKRIAAMLLDLDGESSSNETRRVIVIPVSYGGEFGPDLESVAKNNGITEDEVVAIHISTRYLVYMLGFTPGFPYLGGMSRRIAAPRLETPRLKVPAGSVGIAGQQTGIYPIESPGGWRLIGRTAVKLFDPMAEQPFLVTSGDYLQFVAISRDEYFDLKRQVDSGSYAPLVHTVTPGETQGVHGN